MNEAATQNPSITREESAPPPAAASHVANGNAFASFPSPSSFPSSRIPNLSKGMINNSQMMTSEDMSYSSYDLSISHYEESQFVNKPFNIDIVLNNVTVDITSQLAGEASITATAFTCEYDIGYMKNLLLTSLTPASFVPCPTSDVEILTGKSVNLSPVTGKGSISIVLKTLTKYRKLYFISLTSSHPKFKTEYIGPFNCCTMKLRVLAPLPDVWFKDTGGKDNCIPVDVDLVDHEGNQIVDRIIPIKIVLCYGNGERVPQQSILSIHPESKTIINHASEAKLRVKINEVSNKHRGQLFKLEFVPDINNQSCDEAIFSIGGVYTTQINVKSKTNLNRQLKRKGFDDSFDEEAKRHDYGASETLGVGGPVIDLKPSAATAKAAFDSLVKWLHDVAFVFGEIEWKTERDKVHDVYHIRNPNNILQHLDTEYTKVIQSSEEKLYNYFQTIKQNKPPKESDIAGGAAISIDIGDEIGTERAQRERFSEKTREREIERDRERIDIGRNNVAPGAGIGLSGLRSTNLNGMGLGSTNFGMAGLNPFPFDSDLGLPLDISSYGPGGLLSLSGRSPSGLHSGLAFDQMQGFQGLQGLQNLQSINSLYPYAPPLVQPTELTPSLISYIKGINKSSLNSITNSRKISAYPDMAILNQATFIYAEQAYPGDTHNALIALPVFDSQRKLLGCFVEQCIDTAAVQEFVSIERMLPALSKERIEELETMVFNMKPRKSGPLLKFDKQNESIDSVCNDAFSTYYNLKLN